MLSNNIELIIIAIGIDSWAPITIGDKMFDALTDKYKNRFTDIPIEIPKPNSGNKYFLFGNLKFKKGKRQINTIAILNEPNKIGGIEALRPSFAVGYALPSKNITNRINNVCFKVNQLTHCKWIIHRFVRCIKPGCFNSCIVFN